MASRPATAGTSAPAGVPQAKIDYDLHGLAGIRVLDATPADAAVVARQLGPVRRPLDREPDIVVRFVDRLPISGPVRLLGLHDAGFTDDAFLVLGAHQRAHPRVQIPLHRIGNQVEILCERGLREVPLLIAVVNLTILGKGALPLHASAFAYGGTGVVTTGWSKGGKTESLLAFLAEGADYIGDEWVYLSADGTTVHGIPQPIRLWAWHLEAMDRAFLTAAERRRLVALSGLAQTPRLLGERGRSSPVANRVLDRVLPVVERKNYVDIEPERLIGGDVGPLSGPFDRLFLVASVDTPDVTVRPLDPDEVARRMVFSLQYEQLDLMAWYLKFRFAFPEAANPLLEQAEELQRQALQRTLEGKTAYVVDHPYPVEIPALFEAMRPFC